MTTLVRGALRWLPVAVAVIFLWVSMAGAPISQADPDAVWQAVCGAVDLSPMQEGSHQTVKRLYGLDTAAFEACYLYYPRTNMGAEELFLIKLADPDQMETVRQAVDARLTTQLASFDGYGVEQTDLLTHHAVIAATGNYLLLAVHADAEAARAAFAGAV